MIASVLKWFFIILGYNLLVVVEWQEIKVSYNV
jgi:hypothetical protein